MMTIFFSNNKSEEDIIKKAQSGDKHAFTQIYKLYSSLVFSLVLRICNFAQEAEEATQEVFVTVFRKLYQFNFLSSFKTWLYKIAVNVAINLRKQYLRKEAQKLVYQKSLLLQDPNYHTNPEAIIEKEETVQEILSILPTEQRICLILRSIEGLTYEEIAEVLQININTVRSRLRLARETILKWYKENKNLKT